MQEEGIQVVYLQDPQRHRDRLSHLVREWTIGAIRNVRRVLAGQSRELGLQVQILAREIAVACGLAAQARSHPRAHAGFVVMLRLTRSVDAPKSQADRRADQVLGVAFFPRSAVKDPGNTHACDGDDEVFHAPGCLPELVADSESWRSL